MRSCSLSVRVCGLTSLLLVGCADAAQQDGFGGTGSGPDATGLVPDEGCTVDEGLFVDVSANTTAVATVVRVGWVLDEPASVWALFAEDGGLANATNRQPRARSGEALLLGLPEDTVLAYRLVAELDGALHCSALREARTGWLPEKLPISELAEPAPDSLTPGFIVAPISAPMAAPWSTIMDAQGRVVWAWESFSTGSRIRLSRDRQSMLILGHHKDPMQDVEGVQRLGLDGTNHGTIAVPHTWMDFTELPDGTMAVLVDDVRELDHDGETRTIRGDAVVLARTSGEIERLWSSFDAAWPNLDWTYMTTSTSYGQLVEDWSHVNGLGLDPAEGILYLTAGGLDALFAVDLATGETLWELSSGSSDWFNDDPEPLISAPHGVQPLSADRLLVFNRRSDPQSCSEAVEIELDYDSGTARRGRTVLSEDCLHVGFWGNAERMDNGLTQISWSDQGRIDWIDPDGATVLQLTAPMGNIFGFAQHEGSLYPDQP
jgi:hypothetical protein